MMKKKMKNYGDVKHNDISKSTEIKENTTDQDKLYKQESDNSGSVGSVESAFDGSEAGATSSDKVVLEVRELEEKLAEMQDKYIRLSAEFDNYRKRTLREKMELSKYAAEDVLLKILPVLDDFERALMHSESSADYPSLKNGIDLIYLKFNDFLKQTGVREIEALNCPFNVELHDAIAKVAVDEEDKKGKIIDVIQKGYYLQDKVLRHSKVVVGE